MYEHVRNALCPNLKPGELPPLTMKILAAAITGSISIFFANPMDVVKVRMQSISRELGKTGGTMPSSITVYKNIYRQETFWGFYRGIQPNIIRNVCVNVGEMASYD